MAKNVSTLEATASPDKNFFVESITKDISLLDCVLDLIDNAIDSAASTLKPEEILQKKGCLKAFEIKVNYDDDFFSIEDNAHGISLKDAQERVFRFGSIRNDSSASIGYYGIGLKRASFKIGNKIVVNSAHGREKFHVDINLRTWVKEPSAKWVFPIFVLATNEKQQKTGVKVTIHDLFDDISETFVTPNFQSRLVESVARDYYFFLKAGLKIYINDSEIEPIEIGIKNDKNLLPGFLSANYEGVKVMIIAGIHSASEPDPDDVQTVDPKSKLSGWYVICNNRIILAANKDEKTIWRGKHEGYLNWHPQYNGFIGFAFFTSTDLKKLPWTTTKRSVDLESSVYRRAVDEMMAMTEPFTKYTNTRKTDLDKAKGAEDNAETMSLAQIVTPANTKKLKKAPTFPTIRSAQTQIDLTTISFRVSTTRVNKVKSAIRKPSMANSELGKLMFEEFYQNNVE